MRGHSPHLWLKPQLVLSLVTFFFCSIYLILFPSTSLSSFLPLSLLRLFLVLPVSLIPLFLILPLSLLPSFPLPQFHRSV